MVSQEQRARNMLQEFKIEDAQKITTGDLVGAANWLSEMDAMANKVKMDIAQLRGSAKIAVANFESGYDIRDILKCALQLLESSEILAAETLSHHI